MKRLFTATLFVFWLVSALLPVAGGEADESGGAASDAAGADENVEEVRNYESERLALQQRMEAYAEQFKTVENPTPALSATYERCSRFVLERLKEVEKLISETENLKLKIAELSGESFDCTVVPEDQRMQYVEEGRQAVKGTMQALKAHTEAQQVEGIAIFSKVRKHYRGIPEYAQAKQICAELLAKLGKKWKRSREALNKSRAKLSGAAAEKAKSADERSYEHLRQNMQAESKDIKEVWYVPLQNNLKMLEEMSNKVDSFAKAIASDRTEGQGQTEGKLEAFWASVDKIRDMMSSGKLEEAFDALRNDQSFSAVRDLSEVYLDTDSREKIGEQFDALCTEVRDRMRAASELERAVKRNVFNMEHSLDVAAQQLDRLKVTFSRFRDVRNPAGKDDKLPDKESFSEELDGTDAPDAESESSDEEADDNDEEK